MPAASTATQTVPSPMSSVVTFPSSSHSGTLPGTANKFELDAGQRLERFAETDGAARRDVAIDHVEHAIGADRVQRRLCSK